MLSKYIKWAFGLILAGSLFAGYMSAVKLFSETCAFNETCPYFFGYPACWIGFGMFFIMFLTTIFGLAKKLSDCTVKKILSFISLLGIIFAGRFVVDEFNLWLEQGSLNYSLILPTCAYGLIFYIIIFVISINCQKCSKN